MKDSRKDIDNDSEELREITFFDLESSSGIEALS